MRTYKYLYEKIYSFDNLFLAYLKARKGKSKKDYVIEFEKDLHNNLLKLQEELKNHSYRPKPLKIFILRDPKTRRISKSHFRDRIVHHALCNIIEPIFEKRFIYDSCANRKNKGSLFAIKRFDLFKRKVSNNGQTIPNRFNDNNYVRGYCLKADIKHYFDEVSHKVLLNILSKKIKDKEVILLIKKILNNFNSKIYGKGMPLGNLTSQFFANVYLNELDYFVKHKLKAKYYIRYVDDFVILHRSKLKLALLKYYINYFLVSKLRLELHKVKSKIIQLSRGIDFIGFRNFYYYKLLRKRNIKRMRNAIKLNNINYDNLIESFHGWQAYARLGNTYNLRLNIINKIENLFPREISNLEIDHYLKNYQQIKF